MSCLNNLYSRMHLGHVTDPPQGKVPSIHSSTQCVSTMRQRAYQTPSSVSVAMCLNPLPPICPTATIPFLGSGPFHRARAAVLAASDLCSRVIARARANPPFRPPRLPRVTAAGSFTPLPPAACPSSASAGPERRGCSRQHPGRLDWSHRAGQRSAKSHQSGWSNHHRHGQRQHERRLFPAPRSHVVAFYSAAPPTSHLAHRDQAFHYHEGQCRHPVHQLYNQVPQVPPPRQP